MNYLTTNIAIIVVSATVLHLLLFKKGLGQTTRKYFGPGQSYKYKIFEVLSIISLMLISLSIAWSSSPKSYFVVMTLALTLLLILRMVKQDDN